MKAKHRIQMPTPRQGKCLRFIVARTTANPADVLHVGPVMPAELVTHHEWSDLPHTLLQAVNTCQRLESYGYIRREEEGFVAEKQGIGLIKMADEQKWWMTTTPIKEK